MSNPQKQKGDRGELEVVKLLIATVPDLLVENPMRMLGAGRKDDVGDLSVFPDTAVQVKAFKESAISSGIYKSAAGAAVQAANGRVPYSLGLVLVPRARTVGAVRWVACVNEWPIPHTPQMFSAGVAAFEWVKKQGPNARVTAQVQRKGAKPVILGSLQSWLDAYREIRSRTHSRV